MRVCHRGWIARREEVVHRVKGVEDRNGRSGCQDPFWGRVFEVIEDYMYADALAVPAEAVD
jgi:hypothetical protein